MITLNYSKIRQYCMLYITLPVLIFLLGWVKPEISIIVGLLIAVSAYKVWKQKDSGDRKINLPVKTLVIIGLIALVWCFFAGQGGYYYQSADHGCRNAILRDLINFDWPVIYKDFDAAMIYYIAYWMPAALAGKIVLFFGGSALTAWYVGNFALFIWSSCGVLLVFLLLISTVKADTGKKMIITAVLFIFFSGCDVIGYLIYKHGFAFHIEWWASNFQYSSITTCLFWVFNQTVIPWIITLCLINEKTVKNFAFIGVMCLPSGPFPFLGIFIYCIIIGLKYGIEAIKEKKTGEFIKQIFSLQNIISCIMIVPIFYIYYSSNATMSNGSSGMTGLYFFWEDLGYTLPFDLIRYILFFVLEAGLYLAIIYKKNKKNIIYYITIVSLMFIALFRMCNSADFAMRVSIPAITVLSCMVIEYLIHHHSDLRGANKRRKYTYVVLVAVFIIGSVTPAVEFGRGIHTVIENKKMNVVCDDVITFNQKGEFSNFITNHYEEKPFYKYFAR